MYYVYVPCCSVQPDNAGSPRGIAKISSGARFCIFADQPNAIETSDLSPCARTCHQCTRSAGGEDACALVRLGAIVGYMMLPFCISAVSSCCSVFASSDQARGNDELPRGNLSDFLDVLIISRVKSDLLTLLHVVLLALRRFRRLGPLMPNCRSDTFNRRAP